MPARTAARATCRQLAFWAISLASTLSGESEHGQAVGIGVGDAGDQVVGAGAGGGDASTHPPAGARVAAGHEGGALLVFGQHGADAGVVQRVIHRQAVRAGHAEDRLDTQALYAHACIFWLSDWLPEGEQASRPA